MALDEKAKNQAKGTRPGTDARRQPRSAVHDLVYEEIRRNLVVGAFAPGEKVSLRRLAEQRGTSLTPVRAAVSRLIAEGAFEVMPTRTIMIPIMTEEKFDDICHWRLQLECEAAQRACDYASTELIDDLKRINREMLAELNAGADRQAILSQNYTFHFTIYRASRSAVLLPMIESLWLQAGPFTYFSMPSIREVWNARHHESAIDAIRARDKKAAARAIKADISKSMKFLKDQGEYSIASLRRVVK